MDRDTIFFLIILILVAGLAVLFNSVVLVCTFMKTSFLFHYTWFIKLFSVFYLIYSWHFLTLQAYVVYSNFPPESLICSATGIVLSFSSLGWMASKGLISLNRYFVFVDKTAGGKFFTTTASLGEYNPAICLIEISITH